jgi:2-oxoisovalerate dehydrogenase E1 component beta subunit
LNSVKKTGRAIVVHESMMNAGVGAEVAATIQEKAFLRLEAPVKRVAGWATHTGLMYEQFIIPDVTRESNHPFSHTFQKILTLAGVYDAIKQTLDY